MGEMVQLDDGTGYFVTEGESDEEFEITEENLEQMLEMVDSEHQREKILNALE